ncbi:hypothetical protein CISG_01336 [Coccidioides immitis RMSCC 3703]|uniref:Uncharacterized protein n=1 Tax=Coccidioides immitis RMSCC 3703 TaxID=454286 RepID=A0A0J8QZX0_COCIT|nr:hypothetical protein CISG_01336 [Coccidioides immitis RMSCC 3703]
MWETGLLPRYWLANGDVYMPFEGGRRTWTPSRDYSGSAPRSYLQPIRSSYCESKVSSPQTGERHCDSAHSALFETHRSLSQPCAIGAQPWPVAGVCRRTTQLAKPNNAQWYETSQVKLLQGSCFRARPVPPGSEDLIPIPRWQPIRSFTS